MLKSATYLLCTGLTEVYMPELVLRNRIAYNLGTKEVEGLVVMLGKVVKSMVDFGRFR